MKYGKEFDKTYIPLSWSKHCARLLKEGYLKEYSEPRYLPCYKYPVKKAALIIGTIAAFILGPFSNVTGIQFLIITGAAIALYIGFQFLRELYVYYYRPRRMFVKHQKSDDKEARECIKFVRASAIKTESTPKPEPKKAKKDDLSILVAGLKVVKTDMGKGSVELVKDRLVPKIKTYGNSLHCSPTRYNRYVNIYLKEIVLLIMNNEIQQSKTVAFEIVSIVNAVSKLIDDDIAGRTSAVAIETQSSINTLKQLLNSERREQ